MRVGRVKRARLGPTLALSAAKVDCFASLAMTGLEHWNDNVPGYASSTKITLTSLTLVSVGPVSKRSPVAAKKAVASLLSR